MSGRVSDKVAVITGGAGAIGSAAAVLLAREGAKVVIADIDAPGCERVTSQIQSSGGEATAAIIDLRNEDEIRGAIDVACERYGGLDILFNNAASLPPANTSVTEVDLATWEVEMRINVTAPMLASKFAIPRMIERGGGSIIHTASGAALRGEETRTGYAASKAALLGLSRAIAVQYGKVGIRSNVIAPGYTQTPLIMQLSTEELASILEHHMTPRLGLPEDQASAVLFLASDEASFVTGHVLCVDGGLTTQLSVVPDRRRSAVRGAK